jgi:WD40 repeat protein
MGPSPDNPSAPEQRVNEAVAAYLEAAEAGHPPGREQFLAEHPDLADDLRAFLDDRERFAQAAGQLGLSPGAAAALPPGLPAAHASTLESGDSSAGRPPPETVRAFGDYELLEEIARGGMGVVYRARQVSLQRTVALKMILAGQLASPADVQRFKTEAENAANLDHPHIVPIHEVGKHEGQHYFSMKLIEGDSLTQQLPRFTGDARGTARLLATVARAVHHAHQRGILHRDLKPGNILLDAEGQPHVTDFGLAKRIEGDARLTQSGAIVGTPSYMAPEQASAHKVLTTATDVYSLGAILYEMLTARPPFQAETPLDTILQVLEKEPERPRMLNPQVDRDLETICLKCLDKDPQRRYGTAAELADDLGRWLAGEPIRARPVAGLERTVKWARRRPAVAGLLAALAVVTAVGFAGILWQWHEADFEKGVALQAKQRAEDKTTEANQNLRKVEAARYAIQIALAYREWQDNAIEEATDVLESCAPDFPAWEHAYLRRLCRGSRLTVQGPSFLSVAFSPNGKWVAAGSHTGTISVRDVNTGKEVLKLDQQEPEAWVVAFSPDGKYLASGGTQHGACVWDAETGKVIRRLERVSTAGGRLVFTSDSKHLLTWDEDGLVKWDVATGAKVATLAVKAGGDHIGAVAYAPKESRVAGVVGDDSIKLWDGVTGKELRTLTARGTYLGPVTLSPDGELVAAGGGGHAPDLTEAHPGEVRVWDVKGRERFVFRGHADFVTALAFSPDGWYLVSGSLDGTIRLWDVRSGQEVAILRGQLHPVTDLAVSPDGKRVASTGATPLFPDEGGVLKIWDRAADTGVLTLQTASAIDAVVFSPDGKRLFTAGNGVQLWDVTTGERLRELCPAGEFVERLALSPDGKLVAVTDGEKRTVSLCDALTGHEVRRLAGHPNKITYIAFSPDGRQLAAASGDGTVRVWNAETAEQLLLLAGHPEGALWVAFSSDGRRLATRGSESGLMVWEVETGRRLVTLPQNRVSTVAFSPDGQQLAGADGKVSVWDWPRSENRFRLEGQNRDIRAAEYSPDGRRLAAATERGKVRLWDTATGQEVFTLNAHKGPLRCLAFSPDGRRLACGGDDGIVRVWDASPGENASAEED